MGSFANSLHVRAADVATVVEAVRAVLDVGGYRFVSREAWRRRRHEGDYLEWRSVAVFRPCGGWVGVLDNGDLGELAAALSAHLQTDTLHIAVHDSDSWSYEIRRQGWVTDEFDSMGQDADDPDEGFLSTIGAFRPPPPHWLPPRMRHLLERLREGRAWFWERWWYYWLAFWFALQVVRGRAPMPEVPGAIGIDIPRLTPLDEEALQRHVAAIREVFPEADAAALQALLPRCCFPAENLLVEFLGIIGLPTLYAFLSYSYQGDHDDSELAHAGIIREARLRFRVPAPP